METFELSDEQLKLLAKWQKKEKRRYLGAIGGSYTYSFTPTTLGTVIKVKDNSNGRELDLTDYDEW